MTASDAPASLCDLLPAAVMSVLLILCTCPHASEAETLAELLVEKRLAACVSVVPGMWSTYRWEGRIERAHELLLLIKTTADRFDAVRDCIVSSHPQTVPEVLAVDVFAGFDRYLDWVRAETASPGGTQ